MGRFTVIPKDTFDGLQLDAGVLLKNFDPNNPVAPADEDIICATTGGIQANCTPTFSDFGEDVDNCPNNMMELKHLDGWDCSLGFTSLGTSVDGIKLALGCADVDGGDSTHVRPRRNLEQTDFTTVWWVGDRADGGFVAIKLFNALSTAGFALQTTKSGKGTTACTLTGHVSIDAQDVVPMEFYSSDVAAQTDTFIGDGTETAFVLKANPADNDDVLVYVNGTKKTVTTDYSVATASSKTTVTFVTAPAASDVIQIKYVLPAG